MSRTVAILLAAAAGLAASALWLSPSGASSPAALHTVDGPRASSVPPIRVLLGDQARQRCRLEIRGPYTVTAVGDFRVLAQGERFAESEIAVAATGLTIAARELHAWRLDVKVHRDGSLWLDGTRYRGHLRLLAQPDGRFAAINLVPLEDYLASVLPSEMPADFGLAAQQAQTIAARTYALFQMKTFGRDNDYDLHDSPRSQVYRGMQYTDSDGRELAAETPQSRALVEQTRGIVLAYQGRLFCSYFSAVCGGHTLAGQEVFRRAAPPLVGVPCEHCASAPRARWTRSVPLVEIESALAASALAVPVERLQLVEVHDPGGGIMPRVRLVGSSGEQTVTAAFFRSHLAGVELPSARFHATLAEDQIKLEGRGWGHGVGLCQWGAKTLAEQGQSCGEILRYYYPGSQLVSVQ